MRLCGVVIQRCQLQKWKEVIAYVGPRRNRAEGSPGGWADRAGPPSRPTRWRQLCREPLLGLPKPAPGSTPVRVPLSTDSEHIPARWFWSLWEAALPGQAGTKAAAARPCPRSEASLQPSRKVRERTLPPPSHGGEPRDAPDLVGVMGQTMHSVALGRPRPAPAQGSRGARGCGQTCEWPVGPRLWAGAKHDMEQVRGGS